MVIISTSATEVSIQAVSPEFGVHFSSTAFFGSGSLAQAAGGGAGAAPERLGRCGAGGGRLGVGRIIRPHAQKEAEQNPEGESQQPRTGGFLQRHGLTPVRIVCGAGY